MQITTKMAGCADGFCEKLARKKTLADDVMETPLKRCLTTLDLTLLGVGHMVGAGLFVLTGTVVRNMAGPGAILSYLFAGVAALLAALCYAEFGARVPKAGSAYTYTYIIVGEFLAFMIGWNIILEHLLGVASVGRSLSGSLDSLFNGQISNGTMELIGTMHAPGVSKYPDFVALLAVLVVMAFVCGGVKMSINFNSICTVINIIVILLIICLGFSLASTSNWTNPDTGGFLPYGFQGVFGGAASLFYAFIGFEGIAVAGEEANNPGKSIPIATVCAMSIVTLLYILATTALTLMVPFTAINPAAAFPAAFATRGMDWAHYVVAIGALFGITTSLMGAMFSLPRIVYAMAQDGLLFKFFAKVNNRTQTPVIAIVFFGVLSALAALLFDIQTLVEFLSIGTLLSYTIVAASVIILRYQLAEECQFKLKPEEAVETDSDKEKLKKSQSHEDIGRLKARFENLPFFKDCTPGRATIGATVVIVIFMAALAALILFGSEHIRSGEWWAILIMVILVLGIGLCFMVLVIHEQNKSFLTFQVRI